MSYFNELNTNDSSSSKERASLVPAAAVIPALLVYLVIAAVKKLVVGSRLRVAVRPRASTVAVTSNLLV